MRQQNLTLACMPDAYILGIESSCDETAAAVVRSGEHLSRMSLPRRSPLISPTAESYPSWHRASILRAIVPVVRAALAEADRLTIQSTPSPSRKGRVLPGRFSWASVTPKLWLSRSINR